MSLLPNRTILLHFKNKIYTKKEKKSLVAKHFLVAIKSYKHTGPYQIV